MSCSGASGEEEGGAETKPQVQMASEGGEEGGGSGGSSPQMASEGGEEGGGSGGSPPQMASEEGGGGSGRSSPQMASKEGGGSGGSSPQMASEEGGGGSDESPPQMASEGGGDAAAKPRVRGRGNSSRKRSAAGDGLTGTPKIQTFTPTWEEFQNFSEYMKKVEAMGAHQAGIVKIKAPKEYVSRKGGYGDIGDMMIPQPLMQTAQTQGKPGHCQVLHFCEPKMTVQEYRDKAESDEYRPPKVETHEELARKFWQSVSFGAPIYGAGVCGSLMDEDVEGWNVQKLHTMLDLLMEEDGVVIEGVNTVFLYFGMWKTMFCWHTEDKELYSINYLHFGAPKTWYAVPPMYGKRLEELASNLFPQDKKTCSAFLRHKTSLISPQVLRDHGIPFDTVTQEEGDFIITFPFGYHCGFNHGYNCAESTNFAFPRWVEYGKWADDCHCPGTNMGKISMDTFVRKFQPERYEKWKQGKDWGHHPASCKLGYAPKPPPPETEDNAQNEQGDTATQEECLPDERTLETLKPAYQKMGIYIPDEDDDGEEEPEEDRSRMRDPDYSPRVISSRTIARVGMGRKIQRKLSDSPTAVGEPSPTRRPRKYGAKRAPEAPLEERKVLEENNVKEEKPSKTDPLKRRKRERIERKLMKRRLEELAASAPPKPVHKPILNPERRSWILQRMDEIYASKRAKIAPAKEDVRTKAREP